MTGEGETVDIGYLKDKFDVSDMYDVISSFPNQIEEAVEIAEEFDLQSDIDNISNILFVGMGGSAIGGDLVKSVMEAESSIPVSVVRNYLLPAWADKTTLAIISSYSGNTEESISAYHDAKKRGCRIICAGTGGEIGRLAESNKNPLLNLPKGLPPRGAIAYSSIPWLVIFSSMGLISDKSSEIQQAVQTLKKLAELNGDINSDAEGSALNTAGKLKGKIPLIYVSSGSFGVIGRRWANQIQENAKMLAYYNELPEMNHNEIMGWHLSGLADESVVPLFLYSGLYHERVKLRFDITSRLIEEKGGNPVRIDAPEGNLLTQLLGLINFGDFVSYYLALLNNVDPEPVDIIAELKKELANKRLK